MSYVAGYGAIVQKGSSEGTVTNCTIRDTQMATCVDDDASLTIYGSLFERNQAAVVVGAFVVEAEVRLFHFV